MKSRAQNTMERKRGLVWWWKEKSREEEDVGTAGDEDSIGQTKTRKERLSVGDQAGEVMERD